MGVLLPCPSGIRNWIFLERFGMSTGSSDPMSVVFHTPLLLSEKVVVDTPASCPFPSSYAQHRPNVVGWSPLLVSYRKEYGSDVTYFCIFFLFYPLYEYVLMLLYDG